MSGLSRLLAAAILGFSLLLGASQRARAQVRIQDGFAFSGTVAPHPLGASITISGHQTWPAGFVRGGTGFRGAVSDGTHLWLVPADGNQLVRLALSNGAMTGFTLPALGTTAAAFVGGAFDGTYVWMVPFNANVLLRVRVSDGSTATFSGFPVPLAAGSAAFAGCSFDGTHLWLAPFNYDRVVKVAVTDPANPVMTGYNAWPAGFSKGPGAFWGSVFDGVSVWLVPLEADRVIRVTAATGAMTGYNTWPAGFAKGASAFAGGTFDGSALWLAPYSADRVVRVSTSDGTMTGFNAWPAGFTKGPFAFAGAAFDGQAIWLVPFDADRAVAVDKDTGAMTGFAGFPGVDALAPGKFAGGVFDGSRIWMVPAGVDGVIALASASSDHPEVETINRLQPAAAATLASSVIFRVTFNRPVTGVDPADFILSTTGTATGTITATSATSGTVFDVTVTGVSGDGTLRLDLRADGTGIVDGSMAPLAGGFAGGESYTIDNTPPVITSAVSAGGTYRSAFTYTITASGAPVAFSASGLPAGLSVNATTGAIAGSPTEAGSFHALITAADAAGNLDARVLAITVSPVALSVTGITAVDRIYNGSTVVAIDTTNAALVGVAAGDVVSLSSGNGAGTVVSAGPGQARVVTVTGLALAGADAGNYTLTPPTTTVNIAPAPVAVSISNSTHVFDGTPKTVSVSTTPAGLAVITTYAGSPTAPSAIGSYPVVVTVNDPNYTGSAAATLTIKPSSRLVNLSGRAHVGAGSRILILGFTIEGSGNKRVLIRGVGPALAGFGVTGPLLAQPVLSLHRGADTIASNTGWSTAPNSAAIAQAASDLFAFPLPAGSADSAILVDVPPGAYSVGVSGAGGTTGIAMGELYDADPGNPTARLVNLSVRASVGSGNDILIPGFYINGAGARQYLVRAIGPTLSAFQLDGVLGDPVLTVRQGETTLASNDDWGAAPGAAAIASAAAEVFAFPLSPASRDAAILMTLPPGGYTAPVGASNNAPGIALIEIYEMPD